MARTTRTWPREARGRRGRASPADGEDIAAITEACQDPEIARWTQVPSPSTEEDAREFIRIAPDAQAIVDARTGGFLGTVGWRWVDGNVQVGYWVKRESRGRGVAARALRMLSPWAIEELGAIRVQLVVEPENEASIRVAENVGFQREGLLRAYVDLKGERGTSSCTPCWPRTSRRARRGHPRPPPALSLTLRTARVARALCRFGANPK